jgi:hypothetical protein
LERRSSVALGERAWQSAWDDGTALDFDAALELAVEH